ncbi:ESF1 homolog [Ceratina calcarata]|uniref:ESF1 homolog n=1 Tax=Ceratina calcarata TaxID=156304 RepID=A0AAJ7NF05_9HYME|nr:ESF1 homolog [Ceratina calcarata]
MNELLNDKRFAHIARDPKFKRIPKAERKVKVDKRFQSMFSDKKFSIKYTIDKRGRPVNQTSSENLKKYYDLPSSEEEEDSRNEEQQERLKQEKKKKSTPHKKKEKIKSKNLPNNEIDAHEESDLSDNCFSSNGELLRIKPREECEDTDSLKQNKTESETESDIDDEKSARNLKADLKESRRQLNIREKNESGQLTDKVRTKLKDLSVNYARGEGVLMTDSSSDDESSEASDGEEIDHNWGELDKEAETTDEITCRLAVCNMDWDRIRAVDLMVLFNSFLPIGGFIRSVTIYPSEFGLERMKEEEIKGPIELTENNKEREIEDESDGEEGSSYHMEKLRQYQLNRLKYYYAVVDFNSAESANKIYTECDGTEYESTATKLDLRFIPDDMEFDQTPKEVCTELPELTKYQPRLFTTTALQQVKVELTWDETNPERVELTQRLNSGKLDEINKDDLQAYLATDSSDNESAEEKEECKEDKSDSGGETNVDPIEKYKALLKEIQEKEEAKQKKDVELEFTWGWGAKEKAEKLVQERLKKEENLTPFEQYLEKRKAKKKAKREERNKCKNLQKDALDSDGSEMLDSDHNEVDGKSSRKQKNGTKNESNASSDNEEERRKAELELLLMDENDNGKQHFNMKKIEESATMSKSKLKRLSKKKNGQDQSAEDNFEVNVQDPRFNALFTSHHFNIDPADPHYRRTKGTETLIKEKLKRRAENDPTDEIPAKETKIKPNTELQALVNSVKQKSKNITRPIK